LLARSLGGPAEVIVVGGGVTGCSAALALARGGLRVRLHEAREIAGGASGRNGGFALRGGAMAYDNAREWLGSAQAAAYWRATEAALDRIEAVAGDALRRDRPSPSPRPSTPLRIGAPRPLSSSPGVGASPSGRDNARQDDVPNVVHDLHPVAPVPTDVPVWTGAAHHFPEVDFVGLDNVEHRLKTDLDSPHTRD
jgi:hypothetical protein